MEHAARPAGAAVVRGLAPLTGLGACGIPNEGGPGHPDAMAQPTAHKSMAIPLIAFTVGAVVALLVGVFGRVHEPTLDGTTTLGLTTVLAMKTTVSLVIAALVVFQLISALWIFGKIGSGAPSWVGKLHRASGAVALLLSLFVAYHCLWSLGLEVGTLPDGEPVSTRTFVHGLIGCAVVGAIVVKIVAVRSRRAPGWFLPVAGGLLFSLLVLAILTSAVWYIGTQGWPSRAS